MKQFELTRDVTQEECHWLSRSFKAGEVVHRYDGCTYGCVGAGVACSVDGETPFFELPRNALRDLQ